MGDCLNFVSYYNDDEFYCCTFSLFFFNRINENIIKIQSLLFPKQIEQPYNKETGIRKNNGLFIFRSSVIRIISISLLLITVRRNEQKCQVIPSTLKFLKQPSKSVFSPRKLYYPMVINSIYPTSILEERFQTIVFQRFFIASDIEVKKKVHSKVHRKVKRNVFSFFTLSSYQD